MRAINIAINSTHHQDVSKDDKLKLNPEFGSLYPEGFDIIADSKEEAGIYSELSKYYGSYHSHTAVAPCELSTYPPT